MEKYFLVLLLVGVALAAGPSHHGKKSKTTVTAPPQGENGKGGDHPSADAHLEEIYHHIMTRLHDIETNTELADREKKQQLAGLSQEMRKFISALTGVPLKMIDHKLPHEEAEKLRTQFLDNVHTIMNNHDLSFQEKRSQLAPHRAEYADGIKALGLHTPEKHQAAVGQEKLLKSRAHADIMTKLMHSVKNGDIQGAKFDLQKAMKEEMRMLHEKYVKGQGRSTSIPDSGMESGPSQPAHKKKHATRK